MRKLLVFTSLLETILGISLIFVPSQVLKILLDIEIIVSIEIISRLTGIVYICFGLSCFPFEEISKDVIKYPAVRGMFLYNLLAVLYLCYLKFSAGIEGIFLLAAIVLHALITIAFVYLIFNPGKK